MDADMPVDGSPPTTVQRRQSAAAGAVRQARRRRPTGEPPPLPHQLQTSGVGWLVAAVVLVAAPILVFARGLRGPAVAVTVADDAVVGWLAALQAPGLVEALRVLAAIVSWWAIEVLGMALLVALVVFRRFRHLIVFLIAALLVDFLVENLVGPAVQRPRPFGVVIRTGWGGWAMPSLELSLFVLVLVGVLYTLVPEGRWRNIGKWVAAGLVALAAAGPGRAGCRRAQRCARGRGDRGGRPAAPVPAGSPPARSSRSATGGAAAPTWTSAATAGSAIRQGLEDQLGLEVEEVKPFGLAGSAGSTPLRITVAGDPPTAAVRQAVRPEPPALGPLVQAGPGAALRPPGGREAVQHRPPAGPTGGLRAVADGPGRAAQPDPLRLRRAHPRARVPAGHRVLRRRGGAGRGRDRRPGHRRRPGDHPQAVGRRAGPPRHQAGQPAGPRRPPAADRRRLRPGPAQPLAAGRRPGQHDAVPGPAVQRPSGSTERALRQFSVQEITEGFAAARGLALPSQLRRMLGPRAATCTPSSSGCCRPRPSRCRSSAGASRRVGLWAPIMLLVALASAYSALRFNNNDLANQDAAAHRQPRLRPTWSRCGCRPRRCRRRRWCPACGTCRSAGRSRAWPSTTAGR